MTIKINPAEVKAMFRKTLTYARVYLKIDESKYGEEYGWRFIAIVLNGCIIDSDVNNSDLIKRLKENGDTRSIIIGTIEEFLKPEVSNN